MQEIFGAHATSNALWPCAASLTSVTVFQELLLLKRHGAIHCVCTLRTRTNIIQVGRCSRTAVPVTRSETIMGVKRSDGFLDPVVVVWWWWWWWW